MDKRRGSHARLLAKAARILGGERAVRELLRCPASQFQRWMEGGSVLPPNLFLKVVDLVTQHDQEQLRLRGDRVASLREQAAQRVQASRATLAASEQATNRWVLRAAAWRHDAALALKHRLFDPAFVPEHRAALLEAALDATLVAAGTDLGNVQLIDSSGALRIVAQRGFEPDFLDFFAIVSQPQCACGVAMSLGHQVFIPEVRRDPMFLGTEAGATLAAAGCAAVTSTPLVHETGQVLGMISTHYRKPSTEQEAELAALQVIAARAVGWLDERC